MAAAAEARALLETALRGGTAPRLDTARSLAWRIGFAMLQGAAGRGDRTRAEKLAALLSEAGPAPAALVARALARVAESVARPALDALRAASADLPDRRHADLPALVSAATEEALKLGRAGGTTLGDAALHLAGLEDLGPDLSRLWPALAGIGEGPGAAAASFAAGDRSVELLQHLASMLRPRQGQVPEAADALVAALGDVAGEALPHALMGVGQGEAARVALRIRLRLRLARADEALLLARLEGETGGDPLAALDAGVEALPDSSLLLIERAKARDAAGQVEPALEDARHVLGMPALTVDIVLGAADLLIERGCLAEAAAALERLSARFPASALLAGRAAQALHWVGDAEGAARMLRRSSELAGTAATPDESLLIAQLLAVTGRADEALALLEGLLGGEPRPEVAASFVDLAMDAIWRGIPHDVDASLVGLVVRCFDAAGAAMPADRLWQGVRLFLALDRLPVAEALCTAGLPSLGSGDVPLFPSFRALLGDLGLTDPKAEASGALPREALGRDLLRQGLALLATRREAKAAICFRLAAALRPDHAPTRLNAAFAAIGAGAVGEALRLLDGLPRMGEAEMAEVAWPMTGGARWPRQPAGLHPGFDALRPAGRDWPAITVITPAANGAAFLEDAILSVVRQGYPRLQYILVDAMSQDGTEDIIARHRATIDTLIREPDGGQAEAINKGLRIARGDLVTWLNADDMLAPGALHAAALAWMRSEADLVVGSCLVHRREGFEHAHLPAARTETFTVENLADLFGRWRDGFFFLQPEVFIARRLVERLGVLDEALHYTMDYEFWLRAAAAGARLEPVAWPVALFRKHPAQKTANVMATALEQVRVRDRFLRVAPPPERREEIVSGLRAALGRPRPRIGLVSRHFPRAIAAGWAAEFAAATSGAEILPADRAAALPTGIDIVVKLLHLRGPGDAPREREDLAALRASLPGVPLVGWFWDNHGRVLDNHGLAVAVDVVVPAHAFAGSSLRNGRALAAPAFPPCATQWTAAEAAAHWRLHGGASRDDTLYGGFLRHPGAERRNMLVGALLDAGFDGIYTLEERDAGRYFGLPGEERFAEWAAHKVCLVVPEGGEVSQRLFDALLTGGVPVVPRAMPDLDAVVPPEMQAALPVIRYEEDSVSAVREAWREAVAAFDRGGPGAAFARHRYALGQHTLGMRVGALVDALGQLAEAP